MGKEVNHQKVGGSCKSCKDTHFSYYQRLTVYQHCGLIDLVIFTEATTGIPSHASYSQSPSEVFPKSAGGGPVEYREVS